MGLMAVWTTLETSAVSLANGSCAGASNWLVTGTIVSFNGPSRPATLSPGANSPIKAFNKASEGPGIWRPRSEQSGASPTIALKVLDMGGEAGSARMSNSFESGSGPSRDKTPVSTFLPIRPRTLRSEQLLDPMALLRRHRSSIRVRAVPTARGQSRWGFESRCSGRSITWWPGSTRGEEFLW